MSLYSLVRQAISDGVWKQCSFCNRALPTEEWRKSVLKQLPTKAMEGSDYILDSGLCNYCAPIKAREGKL